MKKLITSIILSTALIGGVCAAAGCAPSSNSDKPNGGNTGNTQDNVTVSDGIQSANEFYSYGAASIGSIISATTASNTASAYAMRAPEIAVVDDTTPDTTPDTNTETTPETTPEANPEVTPDPQPTPEVKPQQPVAELTEEQLATVNNYMGLVENLLGNGNLSYVKSESDREGYQVKEVISYGDLQGNILTYTMYYNSTLEHTETEIDDGEEETESRFSIVGVMVIDGVDYALEGFNETESEDGEEESETYFKVTLAQNSYIIMEQEAENDEKSLVYKLFEDNKVVEKTKFEYETELGETELKMSVEKGGERTELRFSEEVEGDKRVIKVTSVEGNNRTTFKIFVTKDEQGNDIYRYTFGEKVREMNKNHRKGHDKDHDDD